VNIQIFGTLKCQDTRKAQRYFKERRIPFQFINLAERGLSKGELSSVKAVIGIDNLIDREGKEHPLLFKTPIVRNGNKVTVGFTPHVWKSWE
jgi:arsenate reductase